MSTLTLSSSVTVDGVVVQSSAVQYDALGFMDYTREVTTTYVALAGPGPGAQPTTFAQLILVNEGEEELLIRSTTGGPKYTFTALPPGAVMICPTMGDAGEYFDTVSARTTTGTGTVRVIAIYL